VVVEPLLAPLIVLTTVTVQVNPVVAPVGLPLRPLHWSMPLVAALAEDGRTSPAMENALMTATRVITIVRHGSVERLLLRRMGKTWARGISVVFI
jgi:hypothetical protein